LKIEIVRKEQQQQHKKKWPDQSGRQKSCQKKFNFIFCTQTQLFYLILERTSSSLIKCHFYYHWTFKLEKKNLIINESKIWYLLS